jgi:molybdate transport system substrate-binding protein
MKRRFVLAAAAACVVGSIAPGVGASRQKAASTVLVFAASDLGLAFQQLAPAYERGSGTKVTLVLGSTGTLTQQIRNGAPADVFFAANDAYIQQLAREGLTIEATRTTYARGLIVLATLKSAAVRINDFADLARADVRRIAIANPTHAPYGVAAKQALESSGLWASVESKLVYGENVQQAAQFVRSGSVDAAIVARSVADSPDLHWKLVDEHLHAPLNQVAVALARTKNPAAAKAFIEFINSRDGRVVMRRFGFLLPGEF